MKRTVRLSSLPLNAAKQAELSHVIASFTNPKGGFVRLLRPASMWHHLDDKRGFRDWAKDEGLYPEDMNVHLVDQAAFDAVDTCVRHIESCIALSNVKARIWRRFSDEGERHYAYACLARYSALGEILSGGTPGLAAGDLSPEKRVLVCRYLHRLLREAINGTWPEVRLSRSMYLDESMYSTIVVEQKGKSTGMRQYVNVVSSKKGRRIVLPLSGLSRVSGNIRVVLDEDSDRAFVHVAYNLAPLGEATGAPVAIDWGVSEVCTDDHGVKHGTGYGPALLSSTEATRITGQARNKLRSISKKDAGSRRAKHIARNNLGTKKQRARRSTARSTLRTISGAAVKEVVYGAGNRTRDRGKVPRSPGQRPSSLAVEDLSHLRGKAQSKKISRLCSTWMRAENKERMTVHAYVGGSDIETVNEAYTSQTCPDPACGYVSKDNRHGDKFHCRNPHWDCNWQGDADLAAATNLLTRIDDREISRFTSQAEVKKILDDRFLRRLESRTGGRSASPGLQGQRDAASTPGARGLSVDGEATAHGRTPSRPRRRKPDVGGGPGRDGPATARTSPVPMGRTGKTRRLESEKKRSA
ncbi:MAG: zinc ribbon domain-containing protein [Acidimicrobiales bacterium]